MQQLNGIAVASAKNHCLPTVTPRYDHRQLFDYHIQKYRIGKLMPAEKLEAFYYKSYPIYQCEIPLRKVNV